MQTPDIQLVVRWTGTAPGVEQGELHLAAFGEALAALAVAYRRCFSSDAPATAGRLSKAALSVDLKLVEVRSGSTMPVLAPVRYGDDLIPEVLADLLMTGLDRLLDQTEAGPSESSLLAPYFKALPQGIESETLTVFRDGQQIREVKRACSPSAASTEATPVRRSYRGKATLLTVDVQRGTVRVDLHDVGLRTELRVTPEQLDAIWAMKHETFELMAVMPQGPDRQGRCVWAGSPIASRPRLDAGDVVRLIETKWRDVYEVLAS